MSGKKRVCFVAHDMAPSQCFKKVAMAMGTDVEVVLILGEGTYPDISDDSLRAAVRSADLVLLGMSSQRTLAVLELKAGQFAREAGVPYGFYSDADFVITRACEQFWFHDLSHDASLVVGLMHADTANIFPNATIVETGNPLDEEMSFSQFKRGASREKLGVHGADVLVHVAGGKFAAGNCMMLMLVTEALQHVGDKRWWRVVFTPHPGDPAFRYPLDEAGVPQLYAEIAAHAPVPMRVVLKKDMTSFEVLAGADALVELTGSVSRAAAYQRIPVISLYSKGMYAFHESEGGASPPELVAAGAAVSVRSEVYVIANALRALVTPDTPMRERIIANQCKKYPLLTKKGEAVHKICEALTHAME